MKIRRFLILSFLTVLISGGHVLAESGHHHDGEHAAGTEGKSQMPETVSGIWNEVKEHEEILMQIIADGKLDKVHETAFEIRDMVKALAEKSGTLAPESLENVKAGSERVAEIASQLDKYGDAGDKAKTEEQFQRLTKALAFIQSQYPGDILKTSHGKE